MKKNKLWKKIVFTGLLLACCLAGILIYTGGKTSGLENNKEDIRSEGKEKDGEKNSATEPSVTLPFEQFPTKESITETQKPTEQVGIWSQIRGGGMSDIISELSSRTIVIEKRETGYENAKLILEAEHVDRQIRLIISGVQKKGVLPEQILRVSEGTLCKGMPPTPTPTPAPTETLPPLASEEMPKGTEGVSVISLMPTPSVTPTLSPEDPLYEWRYDPVKALDFSEEAQEDGSICSTILITLDKTYEYRVYEDAWNYYISLIRPKDIYPKIVVLDAGHGGVDPGTYSAGYVHWEKTISLNILLYLKELFEAQDEIKVYYTRTTDRKPSLMQRVDLANDVEADFFLSVHCNASESKSLNGTEVLYSAAQNSWKGMNSKKFARICQDKLVQFIGLRDRGLVPRDHNVTIIQQAKMPVALAEVAFMSNVSDMKVLEKEETQRKIAQALYEAILEGYSSMEE